MLEKLFPENTQKLQVPDETLSFLKIYDTYLFLTLALLVVYLRTNMPNGMTTIEKFSENIGLH